jgi:hypothetical protein
VLDAYRDTSFAPAHRAAGEMRTHSLPARLDEFTVHEGIDVPVISNVADHRRRGDHAAENPLPTRMLPGA